MNILIINHYAGSPEMGMEFRPYYFAREWIKMGHKVTIIAGDYSHLRIKNPAVIEEFQTDNIDGMDYYWVRTGEYEGNGVKRAMTMARFVRKLYMNAGRLVKQFKPDVVISSSTYPIDTFAAQRIAKKANARLIHEVHDMWPATLIEVGGMSKWNPFVVMMQIGENSAYKHSDYVVSLAPLAKEYMVRHYMDEKKFVHIANGIVLEEWNNPTELTKEIADFFDIENDKKKFIVGYCGGHALSNALDDLIEVAKCINNENIDFVLVGDGIEKSRLMDKAELYKLTNVFFFDSISKTEIPSLLNKFDCGYIGALNSPLYRFGTCMNKIFDYMASSLPIVCAVTTPFSQVLECQCGECIDSGDIDKIVDAINKLYNMDDSSRAEIGARGYKSVTENYEYAKLAKKFEGLFE